MEIYNDNYCVYVHTNKTNGKKYVGQTCQKPHRRWDNGNGYKGCTLFYRAIEKYTWDGFDHEVVASNLTKEEADNFEKILIEQLDTTNPLKGYNLTSGGDSPVFSEESRRKMSDAAKNRATDEWRKCLSEKYTGRKMPDDVKKKISDAHKGRHVGENNNMYGRRHTEEAKRKISEASKKENLSEETLEKYRARKGEKNPFYGKHHTEESREKIRESCKSRSGPCAARKVAQYDKEGNLISIFDSIVEAAEAMGVTPPAIRSCLIGKTKKCRGFIWRYYDIKGDDK